MSLRAPQNAAEAKFQYCNYGYDKSKYSSFEDCMKRHESKFTPLPSQRESVGEKDPSGAPLPNDPSNPVSEVEGLFGVRMSKGQKWAWVIGITLAIYGVTYYVNKK
jgi:hypothetical protein